MTSEIDPDVKIGLRYTGERFDGGRMPVDVLADLSAFQDVLLGFAKRNWLRANDRQRVPAGFDSSVSFSLRGVKDGSAIPLLALDFDSIQHNLPGMETEISSLVKEAYSDTLDYIEGLSETDVANDVALSPRQISALNRFGNNLQEGESIELPRATGDYSNVVKLDVYRRKKMITRVRGTYERRYLSTGTVHGADLDGNVLITTADHGVISVPLDKRDVEDKYQKNFGRDVQFDVMLELDHRDQYKATSSVLDCDLVDPAVALALKTARDRLTSVGKLEDGWYQGDGKAPSETAVRNVQKLIRARPTLAGRLRIYPDVDGSIQSEIQTDEYNIIVEFCPSGAIELDAFSRKGGDDLDTVEASEIDGEVLAWFEKVLAVEE